MQEQSDGNQTASDEPSGWVIWPAPKRGFIALGSDAPRIADALGALWSLRARKNETDQPWTRGTDERRDVPTWPTASR
jgi:hypothetical protein